MALLFLLAAVLGLVFPPFAVVVLAVMIVGVFAKGVVADSQEQIVIVKRKPRRRDRREHRPRDVMRDEETEPPRGTVIDVRCYPILFPPRLPRPVPKPVGPSEE